MKYYVIAGEASGDLHASNLIREIKRKYSDAQFRAWGGDMMQEAGATLVKHINELAFMGFQEVLLNLRTILGNISFCKKDILSYQPDAVIFIDYPGFNLRIAGFCKQHNIKTIYYISPQVWAWNKSRVKIIRKVVDKMMVILPFEKEFYRTYDYDVEFVGHPLLDALRTYQVSDAGMFRQQHQLSAKPIIALLPGSRKQEISRMLIPMSSMAARFPQYQFIIAGTKAHEPAFYQQYMDNVQLPVLYGHTYALLSVSLAALVTSGTATLETALIGTPQVVCYKAANLSYQIARRLVDLKYISLVNLIMDQKIVTELIQNECNPDNLESELRLITHNTTVRSTMLEQYALLRQKLGGPGASEKAAKIVIGLVV
jgi:lipid-A-disaccharide synthase